MKCFGTNLYLVMLNYLLDFIIFTQLKQQKKNKFNKK